MSSEASNVISKMALKVPVENLTTLSTFDCFPIGASIMDL
jgi:hypothetical protein